MLDAVGLPGGRFSTGEPRSAACPTSWSTAVREPATTMRHAAVTLRLEGDVVELFPPAVAEALAPSKMFGRCRGRREFLRTMSHVSVRSDEGLFFVTTRNSRKLYCSAVV